MMISPDSYVELELDGMPKEEVYRKIDELRQEIEELKQSYEESGGVVYPTLTTKISMMREYLDAARSFVIKEGWEWVPTPAELADGEFNVKLNQLQTITLEMSAFRNLPWRRVLSREKKKVVTKIGEEQNGTWHYKDPEEDSLKDMLWEDFLSELSSLHMGEWDEMYLDPEALDGVQWSVKLEFSDGTRKTFSGDNAFPYNWVDFMNALGMEDGEEEI